MSIDVYQFRPDVNRIIRGSNLATITSRKVRRQLEAEKRMNLCPVKQDLDRLINECFEDIYLPPIPRVPQAPVVPCPQPIYPASYNHVQSGEPSLYV
ncbi:hypothetical protein H4R35_000302 [Dimargaris xerosporica]|nr:hypothetical protein H4R35_000302 [Dimargaris xerosporica]